jgi:hypothetical protein
LPTQLDEDSSNLFGLLRVQSLNTLNLLSILEDDNSGELLELEIFLGSRELVDINFEGGGVVSVTLSSPVSLG